MTITVLLRGGLGNQLFQFAFGRRMALQHATPLVLATHWYRSGEKPERPFELSRFRLAKDPKIRITAEPWDDLVAGCGEVFVQPEPGFCPEALDLPSDAALCGWFANVLYFEPIAGQVRRDFLTSDRSRVQDEIVPLRRPGRPLVSVHIRRGDYLDIRPDGQLTISADRVRHAMSRFDGADFLVFSDDPAWCRENLVGPGVGLSPFEDAVDDLIAMSMCDHHIIANSSFSWWGAWLNPRPSKQVCFPRNWHDGKWPGVGPHPAEQTVALPEWIAY